MTDAELRAMESRILRAVGEAILGAYTPGFYGRGGPQDGDDEPPSFDAKRAAQTLVAEADKLSAPTEAPKP